MHIRNFIPVITTRGNIDRIYGRMNDERLAYGKEIEEDWNVAWDIESAKITESYQRDLDAEHRRTLGLCRTQLHRWAADTFYELFQAPFSDQVWRRKLMEAENMLKPERLVPDVPVLLRARDRRRLRRRRQLLLLRQRTRVG
jgi:hypothetical protein